MKSSFRSNVFSALEVPFSYHRHLSNHVSGSWETPIVDIARKLMVEGLTEKTGEFAKQCFMLLT